MPRKKTDGLTLTRRGKEIIKEFKALFPLNTYTKVRDAISLAWEGYHEQCWKKEFVTTGVYTAGVLLQAIKFANEEIDPSGTLPDDMRDGSIECDWTREEAVALLTAGSLSVQVKLLNKKHKEGKIVNVEARELKELEEAPISTLQDKSNRLIEMTRQIDSDIFAEGDE
jgi:hypothetical protein